jgi:hypothetical protein
MTDTTVAPQGSAPTAAPVNEVAIDPNPVSRPNPIGSQAPQAPTGDFRVPSTAHRPVRRRWRRRSSGLTNLPGLPGTRPSRLPRRLRPAWP